MNDNGFVPAIPPRPGEHDGYIVDAVALARGELSKDAARAVRERMLADPVYRGVVEPIVKSYKEPDLTDEEMEIAWPHFVKEAGLPESAIDLVLGDHVAREDRNVKSWFGMVGKAAAGLMIVVGGFAGTITGMDYMYFDRITTGAREVTVATLPDSSVVTLGPESWFKFREDMKASMGWRMRDTWLRGEATFVTTHEPTHLFEVTTEQAHIVALGTRFKVIAREGVTRVELTEGRLVIRRKNFGAEFVERFVLKAGQSAYITFESGRVGALP